MRNQVQPLAELCPEKHSVRMTLRKNERGEFPRARFQSELSTNDYWAGDSESSPVVSGSIVAAG